MSAYSATFLAGLHIEPFNFGRPQSSEEPLPWLPGRKQRKEVPVDEILPPDEGEALVDEQATREAEFQEQINEAFARGRAEALEEQEAQIAEMSGRLAASVSQLSSLAKSLNGYLRKEAVELATQLAKVVLGDVDGAGGESLRRIAEQALDNIIDAKEVFLRCNPADMETMKELRADLAGREGDALRVRIQSDPSVERGGCVIQHSEGCIDAQPSVIIDVLADAAKDALNHSQAEVEETL